MMQNSFWPAAKLFTSSSAGRCTFSTTSAPLSVAAKVLAMLAPASR